MWATRAAAAGLGTGPGRPCGGGAAPRGGGARAARRRATPRRGPHRLAAALVAALALVSLAPAACWAQASQPPSPPSVVNLDAAEGGDVGIDTAAGTPPPESGESPEKELEWLIPVVVIGICVMCCGLAGGIWWWRRNHQQNRAIVNPQGGALSDFTDLRQMPGGGTPTNRARQKRQKGAAQQAPPIVVETVVARPN